MNTGQEERIEMKHHLSFGRLGRDVLVTNEYGNPLGTIEKNFTIFRDLNNEVEWTSGELRELADYIDKFKKGRKMDLKNFIEGSLKSNGYIGLINHEKNCACSLDNLIPCKGDEVNIMGCKPGYQVPCDGTCVNKKCDFHISLNKPVELAIFTEDDDDSPEVVDKDLK